MLNLTSNVQHTRPYTTKSSLTESPVCRSASAALRRRPLVASDNEEGGEGIPTRIRKEKKNTNPAHWPGLQGAKKELEGDL